MERLKHRPDEELLLRALVQTLLEYSLCIRETEDGKTLLTSRRNITAIAISHSIRRFS